MAALEVDISRNTLGGAGGKASTARVRALERCAVGCSWKDGLGLESANEQFEVTIMHMVRMGMAHAFIRARPHQCSDTYPSGDFDGSHIGPERLGYVTVIRHEPLARWLVQRFGIPFQNY
jgi:hypothetical protein